MRATVMLLLLAGCYTPGPPVDAGPPPLVFTCGEVDAAALSAPVSRVYVVSYLQLPMPTDLWTVEGFDLDESIDAVCGHNDYGPSPYQCGASGGIDNTLASTLGVMNAPLQTGTDSAYVAILVRVDDIDSFIDDLNVRVTVYSAHLPVGIRQPVHAGPCYVEPSDPTSDPSCRLASGQTFDIGSASFVDGLAGTLPRATFAGRIAAGRLEAIAPTLTLTLPLFESGFPLRLEGARLSVFLSDGAMAGGVLGGAVVDDELLASFAPRWCVFPTSSLADAVHQSSDLMPTTSTGCASSRDCMSPSYCDASTHLCTRCTEASIAFQFEAVAAVAGSVADLDVDGGAPRCPPMDAGPVSDGGITDGATSP